MRERPGELSGPSSAEGRPPGTARNYQPPGGGVKPRLAGSPVSAAGYDAAMPHAPDEVRTAVAIREATEDDLPLLLDLVGVLESAQGAHRVFPVVPDLATALDAQLREAIRDPGARVLIAEGPSGPVGMAVATINEPGGGRTHTARTLDLAKVVVVPDARGDGVGRALVRAAEEFGRARGATYLVAKVYSGNADGLRFWGHLGFEPRYEERVRPIGDPW